MYEMSGIQEFYIDQETERLQSYTHDTRVGNYPFFRNLAGMQALKPYSCLQG